MEIWNNSLYNSSFAFVPSANIFFASSADLPPDLTVWISISNTNVAYGGILGGLPIYNNNNNNYNNNNNDNKSFK